MCVGGESREARVKQGDQIEDEGSSVFLLKEWGEPSTLLRSLTTPYPQTLSHNPKNH